MSRFQPAAIRIRYWGAALVCALLLVLLRCSQSDPVESSGSVNPQRNSKASSGPGQVHESSEIKVHPGAPGSREISSGLLPAPGPEKDPTSSPKAAANANGRSANLNKYLSYFDSICPLLSENEEDEVLRRHNRSPEVLVALALMRSKRGGAFLKEAVKGDVPPPIALYGVLSRAVYDGDRVAAAQKLGGAYGDLFLASHYAAEGKSNPEILDALNRAAQSSEQLRPWLLDVRRLQEEIFVSVGRDPLGASARALLESRGSSESTMLTAVERQLTSSGALADSVRGPAAIASLLALNQQLLETQGFDLGAYSSARSQEGILLSMLQTQHHLDGIPFLNVSISQAIQEARVEYSAMSDLILFSHDKAGVFMRIPKESQIMLLRNIAAIGEVSAFQTVARQHPEVFTDPLFAPQGVDPKSWAATKSQSDK